MVKQTTCKTTAFVDLPPKSSMKDESCSGNSTNTKSTMRMESMRWYDSDSDEEASFANNCDEDSPSIAESEHSIKASSEAQSSELSCMSEDEDTLSDTEAAGVSVDVPHDRGIFAILNPNKVSDEQSETISGDETQAIKHQQIEDYLLTIASKEKQLVNCNEKIIELQEQIDHLVDKTNGENVEALSKLHDKAKALEEENKGLNEKLEAANKAVEEASRPPSSFAAIAGRGLAQEETAKREKELAQSQRCIKELQARIKDLQQGQKELQQVKTSLKRLEVNNAALRAENDELTKRLPGASERCSLSADMNAQLDAAKTEAKEARSELLQVRGILKDLETMESKAHFEASNSLQEGNTLRARITLLEEEINRLRLPVKDVPAGLISIGQKEPGPLKNPPAVKSKKQPKKTKKPKKSRDMTSKIEDEFLASLVLDRRPPTKTKTMSLQCRLLNLVLIIYLLITCYSFYTSNKSSASSLDPSPANQLTNEGLMFNGHSVTEMLHNAMEQVKEFKAHEVDERAKLVDEHRAELAKLSWEIEVLRQSHNGTVHFLN